MLETAEQLLSGLGEKGIKGQDRDFTEILDVNRAAISAFDMAYHFPLSQQYNVLRSKTTVLWEKSKEKRSKSL